MVDSVSHPMTAIPGASTLASIACFLIPLLAACGGGGDGTGQGEPIVVEPPPPDEGPTAGGGDDLSVGEDACETDDDCVPAECCHPSSCVATDHEPSCADVMCTEECRYGTLDCGGHCLCHEGRCAARLSEPPDLQVQ